MPNPKSYSRIAIAVSAALTSMVFSAHAAWIDVDSLPSSGLVSSLSPGCRLYFLHRRMQVSLKPALRRIMFINGVLAPFLFWQWVNAQWAEQKPSSTPLPLFRIARRVAGRYFR